MMFNVRRSNKRETWGMRGSHAGQGCVREKMKSWAEKNARLKEHAPVPSDAGASCLADAPRARSGRTIPCAAMSFNFGMATLSERDAPK